MILEIRKFPESQEVMEDSEWFLVMDTNPNENRLGQGSYARILDESEYILVEKTTADEFNKDYIVAQDPGDENTNRRKKGRRNSSRRRTTRRKSIGERRKS
jgi:hypothetical protein